MRYRSFDGHYAEFCDTIGAGNLAQVPGKFMSLSAFLYPRVLMPWRLLASTIANQKATMNMTMTMAMTMAMTGE
ncbi:MAG: hypothetical protein ACNYPE_01805 [Candidatus Azotimanducaceae bacterium WSBS_2022_MAG_OTU7]